MGQPFFLGHLPQPMRAWVEGVAFIGHNWCADHQPRHHPVPHHPAAGSEEEQPVIWPHITVKTQFLGMLKRHPADAVDDAFRRAGGAAGIEDVERIVKPDPYEIRQRLGCLRLSKQGGAWQTR